MCNCGNMGFELMATEIRVSTEKKIQMEKKILLLGLEPLTF